ncbi:MAG TPA: hypothetical protein VHX36_11475 [Candidatus Acidoferrales bacterium]|nr:hypothetical protein [Candidatus Acidoferrales bacterium]
MKPQIRNGRSLGIQLFAAVGMCLAASLFSAGVAGAASDSDRIHWKQVDESEVKLDGKPPIGANVYLPDKKSKKKDIVLVLLGHRYLMLDIKSRLVYVVFLGDITKQGDDIETGDLAQESRLIPSTDWTSRDVGPAQLVKLTLGDYNRVLEVELPHPVDLRGLYTF